tara:strand:+ start:5988 stop:7613 length:1626 start_codon:yes stop_codon:yes gene_type:complete
MDFIKTSLIIGIAVTFYYLLLQWPNEQAPSENLVDKSNTELILEDSNDSLTSTFSPMESPAPIAETSPVVGPVYEIENSDLLLSLDAKSGRVVRSRLKSFKRSLGGENSLELFGSAGGNLYIGNSGYYSSNGGGYLDPNFSSLRSKKDVDGSLVYTLSGENEGLYYERKLILKESGYSVVIVDSVVSNLDYEVSLTPYVVIERNGINDAKGGFLNPERFAYLGPVFSTVDDAYEKYNFGDINDAPFRKTSAGGWVALIQHYFLTAWVPEQSGAYKYQGQWADGSQRYLIGYTAPNVLLGPGKTAETTNTLYVGPKYPGELSKIQENLGLTVDYGFLFWLGKPMYWVLEWGYGLFKNWGLAIIFLTVVVKLILWPLAAKSYVSMGKMRVAAPKMQAIQERYADDKQKLSQEMMEFYKKEGVNPLGGCLPMFLQFPFFIAFYWVLLETVQLRHSGFLWIEDLSAMDPYFVLPILNGLGMYMSQKMTPTPPSADPMTAQMMKFMPVMFAVLFAWFPSGLVLYWLVNMLVQIIQQWWYSRTPIYK